MCENELYIEFLFNQIETRWHWTNAYEANAPVEFYDLYFF